MTEIILFLMMIFILINGAWSSGNDNVCNRAPLGSNTEPLPPDDRFLLEILNIDPSTNEYIPNSTYTVRLRSKDNVTTFIAFTISATEDKMENSKNPRRPIHLSPGQILPGNAGDTSKSKNCKNTVVEANITPKTSVEAIWRAPLKENKCITLYAFLAVERDVWYDNKGPLSKKLCEDRRKAEDMQPQYNDNCDICEEARYQLTFEGTWSYNTHPQMFPQGIGVAKFSDLVGASHRNGFALWRFNSDASNGLTLLVETGNTSLCEEEIQNELGIHVRTLIKANGPQKTNMETSASFRVSKIHHLVSLVTAIIPSPDWFLGVANFELCEAVTLSDNTVTNQWLKERVLNLYPKDAGTDSGLTFESSNEPQLPPKPISNAIINKDVPAEQVKPFAKLHFRLIRTYHKPCSDTTENGNTDENGGATDNGNVDEQTDNTETLTTTTSEEPPVVDPDSSADCPMSTWEDWTDCEPTEECVDGNTVSGFRIRVRYHMVDGVPVGKYDEKIPSNRRESNENLEDSVPKVCLDESQYPIQEYQNCKVVCEPPTTTTSP